ncbi:putative RNA-directed DNA polymerase from transposon BS [Trichonephila clavipes]|nr:putative RNA-directed DNA polymerase from transposon BS [Trichonephila clavipes]
MSNKSPFAVHKALIGIGGEPKSVKRLRSGDLLIETNSAIQTKSFLLAKIFLNSPLIVTPHKSLNSCIGVISEPDLLTTSESEILEGFSDQGVIQLDIVIAKFVHTFPVLCAVRNAREARKLIVPQKTQTYAQVVKTLTTSTATQTDDKITQIICPPLRLLQRVPKTSSSVLAVSTSSTQANLLMSTSSTAASISETRTPIPTSIPVPPSIVSRDWLLRH